MPIREDVYKVINTPIPSWHGQPDRPDVLRARQPRNGLLTKSPTPMRTTGLLRLRDRPITPAEASFASIVRQATTEADFQHSQRRRAR
jgi:hypothetical protein